MYGVDSGNSRFFADEPIRPPLKQLWRVTPPGGQRSVKNRPRRFLSTPLVLGPRCFIRAHVYEKEEALFCLAAEDGSHLWSLEGDPRERLRIGCISRNVLILDSEKPRVRGIEIDSGRVLWSKDDFSLGAGHICLDDGSVLFGGRLYGLLCPETGEIVWSRMTEFNCQPGAVCSRGLLYWEERGEQRSGAFDGVVCLDPQTGAQVWEKDFSEIARHQDLATGVSVPGSPGGIVSNGERVFTSTNMTRFTRVYCLSAQDGKFMWQVDCEPGPIQPVVGNRELYWIDHFGQSYYRVDAQTGEIRARFSLREGQASVRSLGLVANGHFWYASGTEFRARKVETGELVWNRRFSVHMDAAISAGRLFLCSSYSLAPHILCLGG